MAMANSFRDEYKRQFTALKDKERELESSKRQLQLLQKQLAAAHNTQKSGWLEQVNQAISCIKRKDFVSLRSIYRRLFEKVIVHPLERESGKESPRAERVDDTKLQLEFIFNNVSTATNKVVDIFCAVVGLVGNTGA